MPAFAVLIAPLLALYVKYKLVNFAVRLTLFLAVFTAFKQGMQWVIDTVMSKMSGLNLPCMVSYIISSLDIMSMINFALSLWASIFIGRFFYNALTKLI